MSDLVEIVAELREMMKPRLICICDNFWKDGFHKDWFMYICGNCGGLMSGDRLHGGIL